MPKGVLSGQWMQSLLVMTKALVMSSPHFLLLLLLGFSQTHGVVSREETCSLQPIQMQVRYRNCAPKNILAYGCSGFCSSYSQPNPNQPTQVDRSCRCCRELGRRKVAVVMRCPPRNASRAHRQHSWVILRLRVPVRCACRPCSGHSGSSP